MTTPTELETEDLEALMARANGQLITCDRCDKQHFLKYIGKGVTDGGYTTWDKFEETPKGWKNHSIVGLLCPECNDALNRLLNAFLRTPEEVVKQQINGSNQPERSAQGEE